MRQSRLVAAGLAAVFALALPTRGACFMDRTSGDAAGASHDCCGAGLRGAPAPCCAAPAGPDTLASAAWRQDALPVLAGIHPLPVIEQRVAASRTAGASQDGPDPPPLSLRI